MIDGSEALKLAQDAFQTSTTWLDSSLRGEWEKNEKQFQGRHPSGSKYLSDAYKYRSKIYRPKTRATIQSNEADCAFAFFSTSRMVDIEPIDNGNPVHRASADLMQKLLDYRLRHSIQWFKIVQGGWQDALKHGVCVAHCYWRYEEKSEVGEMEPTIDPETGQVVFVAETETEVLCDKPVVELFPVENFRIDPAADWTDPVGTSPYVIRLIPMYIEDVLARMQTEDGKTGAAPWKTLTREELQQASSTTEASLDTTRQSRWEGKEDPLQGKRGKESNSFETVWIHQNFVRIKGMDHVFYTAGTQHLLSDPIPTQEAYPYLGYGERPFVFGNCTIEAHKAYVDGVAALLREPQKELNDTVNLRMDAQKLSVTPPAMVKRSANVDYSALRLRVPGSGVLTDNPQTDIQFLQVPTPNAAAYQEEDRLALSFDDLSGAFAPSSVATNRKLNETVGGMNLISTSASKVADYRIMIFAKTFVEPLLGQIIRMEQAFETDLAILSLAAQQAKIAPRYGISDITDEILTQQLLVTANVGISSTNPMNKMQLFNSFIGNIVQLAGPMAPQIINLREIIAELAGILGYSDGFRFFQNTEQGDDPRIAAMGQQLQQLQQAIETKQVEEQGRNARMQELQDKKDQSAYMRDQMRIQADLTKTAMQHDHDYQMAEIEGERHMEGAYGP